MGIVVDTDVLIDMLREKEYAILKIKELEKKEELATTDINAFELYFGAYKSRQRNKNFSSTRGLLKNLTLLHTEEGSMELAGKILAYKISKGRTVEIRDVLIAAITLHNGYSLLTGNREHFKGIDGLDLVQ